MIPTSSGCLCNSDTAWHSFGAVTLKRILKIRIMWWPHSLFSPQVPVFRPMDLMVEASPRRVFANAHTYHINSISVNSDCETYLSADDLRINLWNLEITDRSFSILCGWNLQSALRADSDLVNLGWCGLGVWSSPLLVWTWIKTMAGSVSFHWLKVFSSCFGYWWTSSMFAHQRAVFWDQTIR